MEFTKFERAALDAALNRLGLQYSNNTKEQLLKHLHLVIEKNKTINLTRISNIDEAIIFHIEDSIALIKEFRQNIGYYCDIGTGAGYPGIPLHICTNNKAILLDSVSKKTKAVNEFINQLGLLEIKAIPERSETFSLNNTEMFNTVIARAVSSLDVLLELAYPLLKLNGYFLALKSQYCNTEIEDAHTTASLLCMNLIEVRNYYIGKEKIPRRLYIYQKVGRTTIKLPRRPGLAKKRPLSTLYK